MKEKITYSHLEKDLKEKEVVFVDSKIIFRSKKIDDLGAYKTNGEQWK